MEVSLEELGATDPVRAAIQAALAVCKQLDDSLLDVHATMQQAPTYQKRMLLECMNMTFQALDALENLAGKRDA